VQSWTSAEIFPGGERRHFIYPFQLVDDAMQMDVLKTPWPLLHYKGKVPC